MDYKEIMKIKDMFENEWKQLMDIGLKRHRNHQILIAREVKSYIVNMKMSMSNYLSEENDDSKS